MTIRWSLGLLACVLARAHDPITTRLTFTQEISRILYRRCTQCHRQGGTAFSLVKYEEARPWAKAIRDEVANRRMPPWGAVKGFGEFANDPSLSETEIEMLVNWVEGGAPKGEDVYLPPDPLPEPGPMRPRAVRGGNSVVSITADEPVEVKAILADGSVRYLLWVRELKERRTFVLREPFPLAPGTRVEVYPPQARATISKR